jgi:hypothetical protein
MSESRKLIQQELKEFIRNVVQQSRSNLTKLKKNHTKSLYNSIKGFSKVSKNSIELYFEMDLYGQFQDQGVRGAGGVRKSTSAFKKTNNKGKIWKQNAPNSPFRFRDKKPSVKHFEAWANSKGLNPYAVRESVYRQGIKPSLFFTKPFNKAFKDLPNELIEKYGLEMADQMLNLIEPLK